ncbi:hypothetical protein [Pseudomarimonas salicorniae]|uniref:Uncharacterized protein n=1 Tax=Pseudomarimonas salicorniae TaxID=2933270 RepID=A0ABT0GN23_9GAMM|nr:hypothetical protein [Lysobacter sp. CAU 1642]MCK7595619.1 hypothetical protein [Lysobacter sp. CAU 1642]
MLQYDGQAPVATCRCSSDELARVGLTLAEGWSLSATCGLRWSLAGPEIDLGSQAVTLDEYTDGQLPQGFLLIEGATTLTGKLSYEPGNAGDLRFDAAAGAIAPQDKAFGAEVASLKLFGPQGQALVAAGPADLDCWSADAEIDLSSIWVLIGDSDQAGAHPAEYEVRVVGPYEGCGGE